MAVSMVSARAKLAHAREHAEALEAFVAEFVGRPESWPVLRAELDQSSGCHIVRIASAPDLAPLVEGVSLTVGDVIHNLRSALDHFCWQLALDFCESAPSNPHDIDFPIHSRRRDFRKDKAKDYLGPEDWASLEGYQPYTGIKGRPDSWSGEYIHPLAHLQELSNTDKHRELPVVLVISGEFGLFRFGSEPGRGYLWAPPDLAAADLAAVLADQPDFSHASHLVEAGAEVMRLRVPDEFRGYAVIEPAGIVRPRVALDGKRPLLPALNRLAEFVQLILDESEQRLRNETRLT